MLRDFVGSPHVPKTTELEGRTVGVSFAPLNYSILVKIVNECLPQSYLLMPYWSLLCT